MEDEPDVARRAAGGEVAAFTALVRAHQADVWRFCAGVVDADSADDLTQETFLRAHRALAGFDGRAALRTWLLGIARHVCTDELRSRVRRRRAAELLPRRARAVDPYAEVELSALVQQLPAERREAFVLTQVLGLGYAEAAELCRCPVGTIRSRVARAREQLVDQLADARRETS